MRGQHLEGVVGIERLSEYLQSTTESKATSKAKKDAGEEGKKTDIKTFNAMEVVHAGTNFALRVEVTARTPAHLGLMLFALQDFLQSGQVGGKGARGLGRFNCIGSRLYSLDPANRQTTVLSSLFGDKASGYALADNTEIDEASTAAQDYIDAADPRLFEAFASVDPKAIKVLMKEVE